jgi:hypothetical protein
LRAEKISVKSVGGFEKLKNRAHGKNKVAGEEIFFDRFGTAYLDQGKNGFPD